MSDGVDVSKPGLVLEAVLASKGFRPRKRSRPPSPARAPGKLQADARAVLSSNFGKDPDKESTALPPVHLSAMLVLKKSTAPSPSPLLVPSASIAASAVTSSSHSLDSMPVPCTHCPFVADSEADLARHLRTVNHALDGLQCPFCTYATNNKSNLNRHLRTAHSRALVEREEAAATDGNDGESAICDPASVLEIKTEVEDDEMPTSVNALDDDDDDGEAFHGFGDVDDDVKDEPLY